MKKSLRKILMTASLSSALMGCATISQKPNSTDKEGPSGTLSAAQIPMKEVNNYFNTQRDLFKDSDENYKKDMLFIYHYAKNHKKEFFEFDGTRYKTDDTALIQLDALITARKNGKKTYIFNGEEKEACSYYPANSQMLIFGNLWEEIRSPQSEKTKEIIQTIVKEYTYPPFQKTALNRIYELSRLSGYPEVKCEQKDQSLMGKIIELSYSRKKTHYEPSTIGSGAIYLVPKKEKNGQTYDPEDFFAELAHAFRDHNNIFGETTQFLTDAIKDITTLTSTGFGADAQEKNYKNKARMEYDTHKVVEPLLIKYIKGEIQTIPELYAEIEKKREKNENTYALKPSAKRMVQKGKKQEKGLSVPIFGYIRTLKDK